MTSSSHFLPLRFRAFLRHPRVRPYVVTIFWALTVFYFLFGSLILFTRWYLLPQVDRYKDDIAAWLGNSLDAQVSIESVQPSWDSFWPRLELTGVKFQKEDPRLGKKDVLNLKHLSASLYWRSFLGTPAFRRLSVTDADLAIRLTKENSWEIAGFAVASNPDRVAAGNAYENPVIEWLMHQGELSVSNSRLRIIDLTVQTPDEVIFSDVNALFKKTFAAWEFGLQAVQESETRNPVDIRARFTASHFNPSSDWRTWSGDLYACLSHFDFADLLDGTKLAPFLLKGHGRTEAWASFEKGLIKNVTADVNFQEAAVQFAGSLAPLVMNHVKSRLTFDYDGDRTMHVAARGLTWQNVFKEHFGAVDAQVSLVLTPEADNTEKVVLTVSSLQLEPLLQMLPQLPVPAPVVQGVVRHQTKGQLTHTTISWTGSVTDPATWQVETEFENLAVATGLTKEDRRKNPKAVGVGFSALTGKARFTEAEGEITLKSPAARLTFEGIFNEPVLPADNLTGTVRWKSATTATNGQTIPLTVTFDRVRTANDDAEAEVSGTWQAMGPAGTANLRGKIYRAKANRVYRYMPIVVGQSVINWLEAGLPTGRATGGEFEIRGDFTKFPWTSPEDNGRFFIGCNVEDVTVDYIPSYRRAADGRFIPGAWPLLTGIKGRLEFEGAGMTVAAESARTHGVPIGKTRAEIPVLSSPEVTLTVDGVAHDELQKMLGYVAASPVREYVARAFDGTTATGQADLSLHLAIPLLHATDTKVKGSVKLSGNDIAMAYPVPPLTDAFGTVHFHERGAEGERISAKAWGHDVSAGIATHKDGTLSFVFSGTASPENINYFADVAVLKEALTHFTGTTPLVGTVNITPKKGVSVTVQSTLEGVESDLPAPLKKRATDIWPTTFTLTPANRREGAGHLISVAVDKTRFFSVVQLPANGSKLPTLGSFAFGKRTTLPRSGLALEITSKSLDIDPWRPHVERLIDVAKNAGTASENAAAAALERVSVDVSQLTAGSMDLAALRVRADMTSPEDWRIRLSGDAVDGVAGWNFAGAGAGTVRLNLTKLNLPERTQERLISVLEDSPSGNLPSLVIHIDDFSFGKMHFGATDLTTRYEERGNERHWAIEDVSIKNAGATLVGSGNWRQIDNNFKTAVNAELTVTDGGKMLDELGWPQVLEGGHGKTVAELTWDGAPWAPAVATINGQLTTELKKGNFKQVDTGVGGAVLSLLSMQSLFKRLQLDFRDLKNGFAFDSMTSSSTFANGVLSSDNVRIIGPQATMLITGTADFTNETLNSQVVVLPDINAAGASLAVAIVNPIVGISTFVAQLLMRDPLSRLFSTEYTVTGTFDNPIFAKKVPQNTDAATDSPDSP